MADLSIAADLKAVELTTVLGVRRSDAEMDLSPPIYLRNSFRIRTTR